MKHKFSTISLAITLSYAAFPAFAAPMAEIVQHRSSQFATIDQVSVGDDTYAKINQGGGTYNDSSIMQSNTGGTTSADVLQRGNSNSAFVQQEDGSDSRVTIKQQASSGSSDNNYATAYQNGWSHTATINQDSYGSAGNYANISQTGSYNEATVNQTEANIADVTQNGHYLTALVTQMGENTADVTQSGYAHTANIYQSGGRISPNTASVNQTAGVASVGNITQTGYAHNATISQN